MLAVYKKIYTMSISYQIASPEGCGLSCFNSIQLNPKKYFVYLILRCFFKNDIIMDYHLMLISGLVRPLIFEPWNISYNNV